jgi:hypothetical protein
MHRQPVKPIVLKRSWSTPKLEGRIARMLACSAVMVLSFRRNVRLFAHAADVEDRHELRTPAAAILRSAAHHLW